MMCFYRTFDHTADLGVEVYGPDLQGLFINAGRALFDLIGGATAIAAKETVRVVAEGAGIEDLMVNWLRELLYLHQVEGYLFAQFTINALDETRIDANARGERFDVRRHELLREIKAVTYHQLAVVQGREGWTARIVFDI